MKKKILTYAGIILAFLVIAYAFVPQVLSGKIVNQSDISGHVGMSREAVVHNQAHPEDPALWSGSMFSGMPTISFTASHKGDWTQKIYDTLLLGRRPASYLFISLAGAFLLLLALGINPLLAACGAVAVSFCSYNLQIIQVGHNTKMQALAFLPWVLAAVVFTYRSSAGGKGSGRIPAWLSRSILGAALFGLALSLQVKANHPQISYYLAILILLYAIAEFICVLRSSERRSRLGRFFAASALLLVLGLVGIGTNAVKLLPTWEYTAHSIRGGSSSEGTKGVDLSYATAWSYGWEELPNMMIPNFNGGASAGAVKPSKSETYRLLKRAGQPNLGEVCKNLPLYWGPQPFTAGPMYMGAVTVFLFLLGLMLSRGKEKWWLLAATVLSILLALGNHLLWFTKLFYDYAPMYSKFRTVSMALVTLQFTLPMLGFLALDKIVRGEIGAKEFRSKGWVALALSAGFCLLCILFPGIAGSFYGASDAGQPDVLADALAADRRTLLVSDAWRSLLLICTAFALIWWGCTVPKSAEVTFKTHPEMARRRSLCAAVLVGILILLDLFAVGKRYLGPDDFVTPRAFKGQFDLRPVDKMILEDQDPSYRVLDLSVNVFNDSHPSYWHKNIGGYSPAKLQIYQKYIENHLSGEINSLYKALKGAATVSEAQAALPEIPCLSELNCRYIIVGDDVPPLLNPGARGNAWFVDGAPSDKVTLVSYSPNRLEYEYEAERECTMVFSEVWYPDGWTLETGSGEKIAMELYGELLRSAVVPAGSHRLVMSFSPSSYKVGERVSRASSALLILLVLLSVCGIFVGNKKLIVT